MGPVMISMSDSQRVIGWQTAVTTLREQSIWRWLFGWGPETFRAVYRLHRTQAAADFVGLDAIADHAHNLPLELLLTLGVVGTVALCYLIADLWEHAHEEGRAAMLGLFVVSLVEPVFFPAAALLFLLLGARHQLLQLQWRPKSARAAASLALAASLGVWVCAGSPRRSLFLHPRESEANQLALVDALAHQRLDLAEGYLKKIAAADPRHTTMLAQVAELQAAIARTKGNSKEARAQSAR